MRRLPKLTLCSGVITGAVVMLLPLPLQARIDTAPGMTTNAANAINPTALQNLTGGIVSYSGTTLEVTGQLRALETTDTGWSDLFNNPNNNLVSATHGSTNGAILGYEFNDLPTNTFSLPSAIVGYGKLDPTKTGNQVFGIFGLAENTAVTGAAIAAEFTCRNNGGAPDTALPPDMSIGTSTVNCVGLHVTSGGSYDSSIGIRVSQEGGSSGVNFNTGIYLKDYTQYGLYIANESSATNALYAAGPVAIVDPSSSSLQSLVLSATADSNGVNLWMTGNGTTTPAKTIRVLNGHLGIVNSAYTQEILTLTDAGALSVTGGISATGGTLTNTTLGDTINQSFHVSSATLSKTSDTTLAVVPGLTQTLTAGKTYSCHGHLTGTSGASGGLKVSLVGTGGLTATQATFTGFTWNGTTVVSNTTASALGANIVGNTAVYSDVWIDGSIVVNAAGTINVEAAQNTSNTTATTVLQGSTFSCVRTN